MASVELWTDGGQVGSNPGPGGWAALLRYVTFESTVERVISGGDPDPKCTNNRMELMAVIGGLEALKRSTEVLLFCDSEYVLRGIQDWTRGWERRGWRTRDGKQVANRDLWERLMEAVGRHHVHCIHVKGHSGIELNERCDRLAKTAAETAMAKQVILA